MPTKWLETWFLRFTIYKVLFLQSFQLIVAQGYFMEHSSPLNTIWRWMQVMHKKSQLQLIENLLPWHQRFLPLLLQPWLPYIYCSLGVLFSISPYDNKFSISSTSGTTDKDHLFYFPRQDLSLMIFLQHLFTSLHFKIILLTRIYNQLNRQFT